MKKAVMSIIFIFVFTPTVFGMSATTVENGCACLSETWLNDMTQFVISKDMKSFEAYVKTNKCIILKSGLKVTVTKSPGMFGGKVEFVYNGIKFWATRESLTNYSAE
ncbi:hypothetical protein [Candidatus Symbiobacter mobilis]|uniref:Uncharacterized protein n=1 Tax=Candidatus Symbiobacter mobilis CR TaxID=946483 RepID=U5NC94_9BURK|nr:hypothetical protein [Candidatus Symbiobacter mobilis]AGX87809.1 hypothetical protein Cenrod_1725 [Candidatus Symbiobacter mobilis CR]